MCAQPHNQGHERIQHLPACPRPLSAVVRALNGRSTLGTFRVLSAGLSAAGAACPRGSGAAWPATGRLSGTLCFDSPLRGADAECVPLC